MPFFNPTTLLIEFDDDSDYRFVETESEISEFLQSRSEAELAHELNHLFQFTSTAFGLASIYRFFETLALKLRLLESVASSKGGILSIPVTLDQSDFQRTETAQLFRLLADARRREHFVFGFKNAPVDLENADFMAHGRIARNGQPLMGFATSGAKRSQIAVDGLEKVFVRERNPQNWRLFGTVHILEGASLALDMLISKKRNEQHRLHAKYPWQFSLGTSNNLLQHYWDPYLVSNHVYSLMAHRGKRRRFRPNLEQLFLISDTALLTDNLVVHRETIFGGNRKLLERRKEINVFDLLMPYVPQNWFIGYCIAVREGKVEQLPLKLRSHDVLRFGDQLIRSGGIYVDTKSAIEDIQAFVETAFQCGFSHAILSDDAERTLYGFLKRAVEFRLMAHDLGGVFAALRDGKEQLIKYFHLYAPGLKIGERHISKVVNAKGESLGSELTFLEALDHATDNFVFGTEHLTPEGKQVPYSVPRPILDFLCERGINGYKFVDGAY